MGAVQECDSLTHEFGVLFDRSAKGIRFRQATIFVNYAVTWSKITARISVEGMADPTGVASAESACDLAISGDVACWDLLDKRVDLLKKGHSESLSLI